MHPSSSFPTTAVGDTLERQKQKWPLSSSDSKVSERWDSFPEAKHAAGDQQHTGETKPLLPRQKQGGACMCMWSLATVVVLPAFLPAQAQPVHSLAIKGYVPAVVWQQTVPPGQRTQQS